MSVHASQNSTLVPSGPSIPNPATANLGQYSSPDVAAHWGARDEQLARSPLSVFAPAGCRPSFEAWAGDILAALHDPFFHEVPNA